MRKRYIIRPTEHGQSQDFSNLHSPYGSVGWETKNIKSQQHSHKKRWGYDTAHRTLTSAGTPLGIYGFKIASGSTYTLYLTDTNLCKRETGGSNTWSYITDTGDYDDSVLSISGTTVTFKSSTVADSEDIVAGDIFILSVDHSSTVEPDTNWATIASITTGGGYFTSLTLSASYTGTTGTWTGVEKDCLIRRMYTTPTNERWSSAIVDDKFCFSNGNTHVQKYTGSGYASALETGSAVATKARYLLSYADRLVMADYGSTRDPQLVAWSKNGDPTDWTDSTAGSAALIDTSDKIMGLGRVSNQLLVYMENSIYFGYQTGISTSPIAFPTHSRGVGCKAPYSIVHVRGTNVFLAEDDFYEIAGEQARPIGDKVRYKFLEIVGDNIDKVVGFHNPREHEVIWLADTTEGRIGLSYDYYDSEWNKYVYANTINCIGEGDEPS